MTYLSAQGIEHRNLHSHNVLITKDWGAKVLEITYEIITYKRVDWKRGRGGCPPFFFLFFDFGRKKKRYSVFKCFFCRKGRNFVGCALFFFVSFCFKRVIHGFFSRDTYRLLVLGTRSRYHLPIVPRVWPTCHYVVGAPFPPESILTTAKLFAVIPLSLTIGHDSGCSTNPGLPRGRPPLIPKGDFFHFCLSFSCRLIRVQSFFFLPIFFLPIFFVDCLFFTFVYHKLY